MTEKKTATTRTDSAGDGVAVYVYGVVPADATVDEESTGVGDPPGTVETVSSGPVAALIGEIQIGKPLGTPEDLAAHARVLDSASAELPVLPLRFGAVMTDRDAVVRELLEPNAETFESSLQELEGRAQFVLRGRYIEGALLGEILDEDPEAARMYAGVHGKSDDASRDARIAFGERIAQAVEAKRKADTRAVATMLDELEIQAVILDPATEWDAVNTACLMETDQKKKLDDVVRQFAEDQKGRVEVRLLGPMAAYDFVTMPADAAKG